MKKIIIAAMLLCLITGASIAQDFKVIKATKQGWAGGAYGRTGINYRIEIETKSDKLIPDTIWVNGNFYPLDFAERPYPLNTKRYDSLRHVYIFSFPVSETHNVVPPPQFNNNMPKVDSTEIKAKAEYLAHHKKEFKGEALITYQKKKKQCSFIIKESPPLKNLMYP